MARYDEEFFTPFIGALVQAGAARDDIAVAATGGNIDVLRIALDDGRFERYLQFAEPHIAEHAATFLMYVEWDGDEEEWVNIDLVTSTGRTPADVYDDDGYVKSPAAAARLRHIADFVVQLARKVSNEGIGSIVDLATVSEYSSVTLRLPKQERRRAKPNPSDDEAGELRDAVSEARSELELLRRRGASKELYDKVHARYVRLHKRMTGAYAREGARGDY